MAVVDVAAGIAGVVGVASGISAGNQARQSAADQQAYNDEVTAQNKQYRLEVMQYQVKQYNAEIDHYSDDINYEQGEFDRATKLVTQQKQNIDEDYTAKVGTELLKSIQQDIARSLQVTQVGQQGAQEHGKADVSAAERGVAGNSANIQSGEIDRQIGAATTGIQRNFDAAQSQAKVELLDLKANHDSAIAGLTLPTFQPIAPPQPPAPVSPINPAAPVTMPSTGGVILSSVASGLSLASSATNVFSSIKATTG